MVASGDEVDSITAQTSPKVFPSSSLFQSTESFSLIYSTNGPSIYTHSAIVCSWRELKNNLKEKLLKIQFTLLLLQKRLTSFEAIKSPFPIFFWFLLKEIPSNASFNFSISWAEAVGRICEWCQRIERRTFTESPAIKRLDFFTLQKFW